MAKQHFTTNLLRFIAAEFYVNICMSASHELFGKSLFTLQGPEQKELDHKVHSFILPVFQAITEKSLATYTKEKAGESGWIQ